MFGWLRRWFGPFVAAPSLQASCPAADRKKGIDSEEHAACTASPLPAQLQSADQPSVQPTPFYLQPNDSAQPENDSSTKDQQTPPIRWRVGTTGKASEGGFCP